MARTQEAGTVLSVPRTSPEQEKLAPCQAHTCCSLSLLLPYSYHEHRVAAGTAILLAGILGGREGGCFWKALSLATYYSCFCLFVCLVQKGCV